MTVITLDDFNRLLAQDNIQPEAISNLTVKAFIEKKLTLATAESCTGGLISKMITDIPGASEMFGCGVCSYANKIKEKLLSVDGNVLDTVGAVSPQTAIQMAQGVRELAGSDVGISTTGIAGPGGACKDKPVGLVYMAVITKDSAKCVKALLGAPDFDRADIRKTAAQLALYLAYKAAQQTER